MGNARMKPERLAEKLSLIREKLKLTQMEMAEELSNEKITLRKSDISRYESGMREPSLIILLSYARLAHVTMEILVDDKIEFPKM
jgi:transcriptional regulator with XRE-family HTH domain